MNIKYKRMSRKWPFSKQGNVRLTIKWKSCSHDYLSAVYLGGSCLPAVFVAPSWLAVIPSVVLHSSSSFSSSSPWLSPDPSSKDWLRPLSLSLQFCPEELPTTGEALHWEEGLFVGLMATGFPWETRVWGVEGGGLPCLPKAACPLTLLSTRLTPGSPVKLFELTGGWGLQSGGELEVIGVMLHCGFFPLDIRTGTGGGDETGAAEEGWGEVGWRSWGMKAGPSLCGETGGVWKLSPWAPRPKKIQTNKKDKTCTKILYSE